MSAESKEQSSVLSLRDCPRQLAEFRLDERRFAIPISAVERVVRIVEILMLPQAPDIVLGVVDVHGQIVPVVNMRRRFRLAEREISLSDHLMIARTSRRTLGFVADVVVGMVQPLESEMTVADTILPGLGYVEGVAKLPDGLILVHNLDTLLSFEEEENLEEAMTSA